jgi:hypothetical protein
MRRLLLAVCLLPVLALSSASALAEPLPPRDEIVPEGIEGLSAGEIRERGFALLAVGDHKGWALVRAAADRGDGAAAFGTAIALFVQRGPGWAREVHRYARIAADADPDGDVPEPDLYTYFLLAESGRALDPPVAPAQLDIWYRLSILFQTRHEVLDRRTLREGFERLRMRALGGAPFPPRYDALLAEEMALRRADAAAYLAAAQPVCASALADSGYLCLQYRVEAGERGHAPSRYRVAIDLLDGGARLRSRKRDLEVAARFLCKNADLGDMNALERLALLIVRDRADVDLPLWPIALALRVTDRLPSESPGRLYDALVSAFSEQDRRYFDLFRGWDRLPSMC